MNRNQLITEIKCILHDAAKKFTAPGDQDFIRHLDLTALDMSRVVPRRVKGTLTLVADVDSYTVPADFDTFGFSHWGIRIKKAKQPWNPDYLRPVPQPRVVDVGGVRNLYFDTPPNAQEINTYGVSYDYFYAARHAIGDTDAETTIQDQYLHLVLLRASAEAMKELANRNVGKPVQLRDGLQSGPKNGTPAALYKQLMDEFDRQAA